MEDGSSHSPILSATSGWADCSSITVPPGNLIGCCDQAFIRWQIRRCAAKHDSKTHYEASSPRRIAQNASNLPIWQDNDPANLDPEYLKISLLAPVEVLYPTTGDSSLRS